MPDRIESYRKVWSIFQLLLLAVTYPLWIGVSDFPEVGLLTSISIVSPALDWILLATLVAGFALQWSSVIVKNYKTLPTLGLWLIIVALLIQFMIDQHRIQAWAYHSLFAAIMILPVKKNGDAQQAVGRLRWLVIGVYFFSSVSKIDATFVNNLGPSMLGQLLEYIGVAPNSLPEWLSSALVLSLPITEGLIGICLIFERPRTLGCVLAIMMHASLIAVVGPWGWQHQWGVVAWNGFFIAQAIILFRPGSHPVSEADDIKNEIPEDQESPKYPTTGLDDGIARAALAFVMIFPTLAWFDVADHWPSWELYAPRTSRAEVWVSAHAARSLPENVRVHLEAAQSDGWQRLDVAAWSLQSQYAPIYPEDRFQIGVALGLRRWLKDDRSVRVQWRSSANRWTGERETKWLYGFDQINQFADGFRLNAKPNKVPKSTSLSSNN